MAVFDFFKPKGTAQTVKDFDKDKFQEETLEEKASKKVVLDSAKINLDDVIRENTITIDELSTEEKILYNQ